MKILPETLRCRWAAGKTVFSVNHGKRLYRPKGMDAWILIYTLDGAGRVKEHTKTGRVEQGDVLSIPPYVVHDYSIAPDQEDWIQWWLYFHPTKQQEKELQWNPIEKNISCLTIPAESGRANVVRAFSEIARILNQPLPTQELLVSHYIQEIILWCMTYYGSHEQRVLDFRIQRVLDFLSSYYHTSLRIPDMADIAGMSVSHFHQVFEQELNLTPAQYLEYLRLEEARRQLTGTNKKLANIAQDTGFFDQAHLSKRFKDYFKVSPGYLRKTLQQGNGTPQHERDMP